MAEHSKTGSTRDAREAARRRARLDAVFGEVLPEQTRDDAGSGDGDGGTSDAWLRREVPPHHGS